MPRPPGKKWASDQRPYFKEPFDRLLDESAFEDISPVAFRFRMLFRAMLKRAWNEIGILTVTPSMMQKLSGKKQSPSGLKVLQELAESGLLSFTKEGKNILICDPNWVKDQGYSPQRSRTEPAVGPNSQTQIQIKSQGEKGESRTPPSVDSREHQGKANRRQAEAQEQVLLAMNDVPTEPKERSAELRMRIRILAEMFLATSRIADASQLRSYARMTREIPAWALQEACDQALKASERGFPPAAKWINEAGQKLEMQARKRARAQQAKGRHDRDHDSNGIGSSSGSGVPTRSATPNREGGNIRTLGAGQ